MTSSEGRLGKAPTKRTSKLITYVLLGIGTLFFLFPVVWMLSTSLQKLGQVYQSPPLWIPNPFQWRNYVQDFGQYGIGRALLNSSWYSLVCALGGALSSSLVAFGFARLKARGSNVMFGIVLATMMLPFQVTMIPQYLLFKQLGWLNTYLPLIIPAFGGGAFNIFLLRQFYRAIPRDYDESVKIDGGGYMTLYLRVILPLSVPAVSTVAILEFMGRWNDLMGPLIYINNPDMYPVSVALANFSAAFGGTPWNLLMAASVVTIIPPLIVFFFTQKHLMRGIAIGGAGIKA